MRVAVLGRTAMLLHSIELLQGAGHQVVLIGTCKESPEYNVTANDFEQIAKDSNLTFFNDSNINGPRVRQLLVEAKADIAISVNWLTLIAQDTINIFPFGILNAHAGDLPRYRGNACPNWAILSGENRVTVTIHQMEEDLDAGPVLLKRHYPIQRETRVGDVYDFLEKSVPEMFVDAVSGLESGNLTPQPQPQESSAALRCYPRIPSDSFIDWTDRAEQIDRLVKASSEPFSGAYTYYLGKKLTIWRSYWSTLSTPSLAVPGHVLWKNLDTCEIGVATGDGVLVLQEIEIEGHERDVPTKYISSLRSRLGMMVEDEIASIVRRIDELEKRMSTGNSVLD